MSTEDDDGRVIPAVEGETYRLLIGEEPHLDEDRGMLVDDRLPEHTIHTVGPKCDEDVAGFWCCVTHGTVFTHQIQKDFHITRGPHVLTWICLAHGPEVP